jgi:chromosome segregation ATPase
MCRKLFLAAVAVLVALVVIRKTEMGSLLQVWWNDARSDWKKQIKPETRIKQLKLEIAKIDKDLKAAVDQLINRELDRNNLRDQIVALREKVAAHTRRLTGLVQMADEAQKNGSTLVSFEGRELKSGELRNQMARVRLDLQNAQTSLENKEEILKLKDDALAAADEKITKIKNKKAELEKLVTALELQLEQLQLKKVENAVVVDDTHVARAQALYEEICRELKAEELRAEKYQKYGLTTPTESSAAPKKDDEAALQEELNAAKALLKDKKVAGQDIRK